MPYSKLLRNIIAESNYTNMQIIEKLNQKNIHIDKSYLSKLVHGKLPAPREEISRTIAQICNVDERKLVLEGYFDKAPQEIKDVLYYIQNFVNLATTSIYSNISDIIDNDFLTLSIEKTKQEPINDFLIYVLDCNANNTIELVKGFLSVSSDNDNFSFQLEEPISLTINNDDMAPIIPNNSKITLEICDQYQSGDIVALKYDNEIIVRYYFINNDIVSFNAIQKNAKAIDINKKDIKILGKVKKVITEIQ